MSEDYIEAQEAPHVEAGAYLAELEKTERVKTRFGEARKWFFRLPQEDGAEVSMITRLATSAGSNGGRVIRALLGRGLSSGEKLPLEELAGRRCLLTLSVNDNGIPTTRFHTLGGSRRAIRSCGMDSGTRR